MTDTPLIAQRNLLCVNCAGQCVFAPETGTLTCTRCATAHEIAVDPEANPAAEQHYHPDLPHTEQPRFERTRPYQCETCGGRVVFHGHSISERCPYCEGALVEQAADETYQTLGVIPFAVTQASAQENALAWVRGRWAAPSDLPSVVAQSRVFGIYVPFWTFDSTEAVNYIVTYRVKSGKRTTTKTRSGRMSTEFDDLLMPASGHVTPLIRDGILHEFDPRRLRPPEPAFFAGFAAELHHQTVHEGLRANASDKDLLLRNRIKTHSGVKGITNVSYKTDTTGIRYRRILLPVWILHYTHGGKAMKVVTCGLRGRTFGERPFSMAKLFGYASLLAAGCAGFGFAWGAAGFY